MLALLFVGAQAAVAGQADSTSWDRALKSSELCAVNMAERMARETK